MVRQCIGYLYSLTCLVGLNGLLRPVWMSRALSVLLNAESMSCFSCTICFYSYRSAEFVIIAIFCMLYAVRNMLWKFLKNQEPSLIFQIDRVCFMYHLMSLFLFQDAPSHRLRCRTCNRNVGEK